MQQLSCRLNTQLSTVCAANIPTAAEYQSTAKQWTQTYAHAVRWPALLGHLSLQADLVANILTHFSAHNRPFTMPVAQRPTNEHRRLTYTLPAPALPSSPFALAQQQVVGLEAKVQAIAEMGFGREQALEALRRANGDEQQAMEFLLGA